MDIQFYNKWINGSIKLCCNDNVKLDDLPIFSGDLNQLWCMWWMLESFLMLTGVQMADWRQKTLVSMDT